MLDPVVRAVTTRLRAWTTGPPNLAPRTTGDKSSNGAGSGAFQGRAGVPRLVNAFRVCYSTAIRTPASMAKFPLVIEGFVACSGR